MHVLCMLKYISQQIILIFCSMCRRWCNRGVFTDLQVPVKVLRAHSDTVTAARLCFNEDRVLSCSADRSSILWVNATHRHTVIIQSDTHTQSLQFPITSLMVSLLTFDLHRTWRAVDLWGSLMELTLKPSVSAHRSRTATGVHPVDQLVWSEISCSFGQALLQDVCPVSLLRAETHVPSFRCSPFTESVADGLTDCLSICLSHCQDAVCLLG